MNKNPVVLWIEVDIFFTIATIKDVVVVSGSKDFVVSVAHDSIIT